MFPGEFRPPPSSRRVRTIEQRLTPSLFSLSGAAAAGAKVHSGFQSTQAYTAAAVLAAVKTGVSKYGTSKGELDAFDFLLVQTNRKLTAPSISFIQSLPLGILSELPSLSVSSVSSYGERRRKDPR